jgi:hypothetical protein
MEEPSSGGGVPEWVVTFGDMMSLLLTFFIMLVSFSELKSEEKYQALMDALQRQYRGRVWFPARFAPAIRPWPSWRRRGVPSAWTSCREERKSKRRLEITNW